MTSSPPWRGLHEASIFRLLPISRPARDYRRTSWSTRLLGAGAVGLNLEDTDHASGSKSLVDADAHSALLAAVKNAARARGVELLLNARVDVHLRQFGEEGEQRLTEALHRSKLYLATGADSFHPTS